MNIHYRVIDVSEKDRLIIVRYYTDILSERDLSSSTDTKSDTPERCRTDIAISIPFPEPSVDELHRLITINAPDAGLKTLENIKQSDNLKMVYAFELLNKTYTKTQDEIKEARNPKQKIPTSEELADIINKINPKK